MAGFDVEGDLRLNADETDFVVAAGAESVEQQIRTGALNWDGFTPYGDKGLPMTTDILGKGRNLAVITQIFREWFAGIDGVVSVDRCEVALDRTARRISVLFALTCENGETLSSEVGFSVG